MILKKLDIHAHVTMEKEYPAMGGGRDYALTPEDLRGMYDKIGVEKGVALPLVSPEYQTDQLSNRDARLAAEQYPETIGWWFCNVDPRWMLRSPDSDFSVIFNYYKSKGAKGIGEFTPSMRVDDPLVQNVFRHAEACDLPVLFHIGPVNYKYGILDDLGLPNIEKTLQRFPKLRLIGHSHMWWSEISGDCTDENRGTDPKGPVVPGGRAVELMRNYPGMLADLSAGSGENAIMRDPEFGYKFLEEFQDKIFFGVDYCTLTNYRKLSAFLDEGVETGRISQKCYNKICRENLLALVGE